MKMLMAGAVCALAASVSAQSFTKEDSGWVPLFNGKDYTGLYSRMYNAPVMNAPNIDPAFQIKYQGTDSVEIYVKPAGGTLGTQRNNYSHYRVRIQYRFDDVGNHNAGLLYAVDETYPRMGGQNTDATGNWPRGIECQMLQNEGGDAYSIQQVTFDTRVTNGAWDPNGKPIKVCQYGCDGRNFHASPRMDKLTGWNSMEAIVRGTDTATHFLNGPQVFKLWNIRITDNNGQTLKPWPSGAIGLEAEGSVVHYRRWEVMELPKDGPNYLNRLFISAPAAGEKLVAQSPYTVKWRHIGDFKKAYLQYDVGSGWQSAGDSVDNSGSYAWTVPNTAAKTLRLRISGPDYVRADSTGNLEVTAASALIPRAAKQRLFANGKGEAGAVDAPRLNDASGRLMRKVPAAAAVGFAR